METEERTAAASKVIYAFCRARTNSLEDAEDLSQDVLLALSRSLPSLRDEGAFYGFMWSVARHVYRQWLEKRRRTPQPMETLPETAAPEPDEAEDIALLRRELALLREKYRRVTILYYMRGLNCAAIAAELALSESMVKYLLFKARTKLKEGMTMERIPGKLSYDTRRLQFRYWSNEMIPCYPRDEELISQNILFACYNDRLSPEEISLEIGVGLPYMEKDLALLEEYGLVRREGKRYSANLVIFTQALNQEIARKTEANVRRIAQLIRRTVEEKEAAVRAIGFSGADMPIGILRWQLTCILLFQAVICCRQESQLEFPVGWHGKRYFVWGVEAQEQADQSFIFGTSGMENERGDALRFMDFPFNGEMLHHSFCRYPDARKPLMELAAGRQTTFTGPDAYYAAELIKHGMLRQEGEKLAVNFPVFTRAQWHALMTLLNPDIEAIRAESEALMGVSSQVLQSHVPAHLRSQIGAMAYFHLFDDAVTAPVALLASESFLLPAKGESMLPATYMVTAE